jgi:hypothetical protein
MNAALEDLAKRITCPGLAVQLIGGFTAYARMVSTQVHGDPGTTVRLADALLSDPCRDDVAE